MSTARTTQRLKKIQHKNLVRGFEMLTYDAAGLGLLISCLNSLAELHCKKDRTSHLLPQICRIQRLTLSFNKYDTNAPAEILSRMCTLLEEIQTTANDQLDIHFQEIHEIFFNAQHKEMYSNSFKKIKENLNTKLNFLMHAIITTRIEVLTVKIDRKPMLENLTPELNRKRSESSSASSFFSSDLAEKSASVVFATDSSSETTSLRRRR